MYICIHLYIYIPKYSLLRPYTITCIHVFGADHLALDKLIGALL